MKIKPSNAPQIITLKSSMLFNKTTLGTYLKPALRWLFSVLLAMGIASAFPPAPYYTLYGMVRDQVG